LIFESNFFEIVLREKAFFMKIVRLGIMKHPIQIKLYDIFRNALHMPDQKAQELVQTIDEAVKEELEGVATKELVKDEIYATKALMKDQIHKVKYEIHALEIKTIMAIYVTSLIQFLAIVGSVIAIINFMLRK